MNYRKRSVTGYVWQQNGWVFVVLVLAGLGLGALKFTAFQAAARFAVQGVEAVGQVTHMDDYSSKRRTTYRMSYTFPTPADPYNGGIQRVSGAFYDAYDVGSEVVVRYIPSDPTLSVVDPDTVNKYFGISVLVALGLIVAGGVGGVFAVARARAAIGLRQTGDMVSATVTGHAADGTKGKAGHIMWRDAAGQEGRSLTATLDDFPAIGTQIILFADPARHRPAVWEGDVGSR